MCVWPPTRNVIALRRHGHHSRPLLPAHRIGQQSQTLARISSVKTSAERTAGTTGGEDLAVLAPVAAAALDPRCSWGF
ncbi:hypothetical protein ACPF8X_09755 [Streptomyces sp. G35A]